MPELHFYGGANEIGGNKILLEDGATRLFFDFGTSYMAQGRFFEEFLKPRSGYGLHDYLQTGLLPPLHGIYRPDLEPSGDFWNNWQPSPLYRALDHVDGVLLSHAHLDHTGAVSFLRQDIPLYATRLTALTSKAIQDSGKSGFEMDLTYVAPRECKNGVVQSARSAPLQQRPLRLLDGRLSLDGERFWNESPLATKDIAPASVEVAGEDIGEDSRLRWYPVDHSIYGAAAFAVETSGGWVAYTGDLRLHGRRGAQTQQAVEAMAALKPTVLLCEGTSSTGDESVTTEEDVHARAAELVSLAKGKLIFADFGPRNIERLLIFHEIARDTGRRLAVLSKDAYLLEAMHYAAPGDVPDLGTEPDFALYEKARAQPDTWERRLLERNRALVVSAEDIRKNPGRYVLCFSFWDVNELSSLDNVPAEYIYSSSEAFNEEMEIDHKRLRNWLEYFEVESHGLEKASDAKLHASGHASGKEIIDIIRQIHPQRLVPIHTKQPQFFREELAPADIEVVLPSANEPLRF